MGTIYGKCLNVCCPSSPAEQEAQRYMDEHDIYDVPDRVSKTFQWILLISVAVEFIIAVGALVFGIYGYNVRQEFGSPPEIDDVFIDVLINLPIALIVMGSISIVFVFLGGLGAIREYVPLLATYLAYLILITIFEVFVGIYFLAKKDSVMDNVQNYFSTKGIENYFEDIDLKNIIDYVQHGYHCCGSVKYTDWGRNMYFNCSSTAIQSCSVPASCCVTTDQLTGMDIITNSYCGKDTLQLSETEARKVIYTVGCFDTVLTAISAYTIPVIIVVLVLVICPLIQEICIAFLIYDVNAEHQAFEMWKADQMPLRSPQPIYPLIADGGGDGSRTFGWAVSPVK